MSYILDALKKSDQQRHRGTTPTLQTLPSSVEPGQGRRSWLYPALALTVAAIAFAVGSLRPWHTEPAVVAAVTSPPAVAARVAAPAIPPALATEAPPAGHTTNAAETIAPKEPAKMPTPEPQRSLPAPSAAPQAPASDPSAHAAATSHSSTVAKEEKASEDRVVALADLPPAIRAELPPMNVTVHAYARIAKDRLVGVNDKLLREGDTLTPDLVLERITPDGMIFAYKGTRFQRGVR